MQSVLRHKSKVQNVEVQSSPKNLIDESGLGDLKMIIGINDTDRQGSNDLESK